MVAEWYPSRYHNQQSAISNHPSTSPQDFSFFHRSEKLVQQEVELFEKRIYELEKMNIYLKLAHEVLDSSNSMEGPEIIENISDMTESEKEKKKAEVTIFTAKCNAAIDVVKELEALRIKAERKHREAEKQYEAFCKRNRG